MLLDDLLKRAIDLKQGNKEFCLRYEPPYIGSRGPVGDMWTAEIGNTSPHVQIGESVAEFYADGKTPAEAVAGMIAILQG